MTRGSKRGPLASLTAPPPLLAEVVQQLREAQGAHNSPKPPKVHWSDLVDDPLLLRYFGVVFNRPGSAIIERGNDVIAIQNGDTTTEIGRVQLADYFPFQPITELLSRFVRYDTDRTQRHILPLRWVRNVLLHRLFAALDAALDVRRLTDRQAQRDAVIADRAMSGCYSYGVGGKTRRDSEDGPAVDEASKLLCGAAKWRLEDEFGQLYPQLAREDEEAKNRIALRKASQDEHPEHFLNWAWTYRRQVTLADLAEYGVDELHWLVLTHDETVSPAE